MKWFKLAIEDRRIILQQASALSGVNEKALEKDLWVTMVLEALFKTTFAPHLHFKGETSLSKAWQIIERFSEDIDLSIDRSFYGFGEDLSYSQIKKLKRISSEFVSSDFREELEKTLVEMGESLLNNLRVVQRPSPKQGKIRWTRKKLLLSMSRS
jgi:predicted nucleotidyltransferase component of viral defense system